MARYFCTNSLAGCKRSSTGVVDGFNTAGRFDSAYVANGISVPNFAEYIELGAPFCDGSSSATTLWTRFDVYNVAFSAGLEWMKWLNAGNNAYRVLTNNGSGQMQMQYWNSGTSAWVNWGSTFTIASATLYTMVVQIVANVSYAIYIGGSLVASSAVVPTNGATAITAVRLNTPGSAAAIYSQIMGADYNIIDGHVMQAALNGNSATNTSGTGAYTDINETVLDESTAVLLAAAGKKGQTHASITLPAGHNIIGAVVNARGRVSGGTITSGKVGMRSSSSNVSSSDLAYTGNYEPRGAIFTTDSAAAAWTQTSFNNAEPYEEAA